MIHDSLCSSLNQSLALNHHLSSYLHLLHTYLSTPLLYYLPLYLIYSPSTPFTLLHSSPLSLSIYFAAVDVIYQLLILYLLLVDLLWSVKAAIKSSLSNSILSTLFSLSYFYLLYLFALCGLEDRKGSKERECEEKKEKEEVHLELPSTSFSSLFPLHPHFKIHYVEDKA